MIKTREKLAYGVGDLGNNIAYGAMGFYFVFFLTDVAGLSPVWAGNIFLIIRLWNAVSDLLIGVLSDRVHSRFGRRRPFLLTGAIPLMIGFALLWTVPFDQKGVLIIYFMMIGIIFNTLYSYVSIPYNALLPEMSQDPDERTSIAGYKMACSFIGSLLSAMGVTLIVDVLYPGKLHYLQSFPAMGRILGAILALCILAAFFGTKERVREKEGVQGEPIFHSLVSLVRLRAFRQVLGMFIFNMVAFDIIMALYIYFMKYTLLIDDSMSSVFMAIPLVAAVLATPLWVKLSQRIGKKQTYIISALYFMLPLAACLFLPAGNIPLTIVLTILIGVGISASQVLIFSILPDVVEIDEQSHGIRREGVIYGVSMFLYKISSAVIVAGVTASLGLFGYLESTGNTIVTQPASAVLGIRILMSLAPILCLVITIIFIRGFQQKEEPK